MVEKGKIIGIINIIVGLWILIYFVYPTIWAVALVLGSIFISFDYYWINLHRSFWILGMMSFVAFYYFSGRLFFSGLDLLKRKSIARRRKGAI